MKGRWKVWCFFFFARILPFKDEPVKRVQTSLEDTFLFVTFWESEIVKNYSFNEHYLGTHKILIIIMYVTLYLGSYLQIVSLFDNKISVIMNYLIC